VRDAGVALFRPFYSAADFLRGGFSGVWNRYVALVGVSRENDRLRKEVTELRERLHETRDAVLENRRLKELLRYSRPSNGGPSGRAWSARRLPLVPGDLPRRRLGSGGGTRDVRGHSLRRGRADPQGSHGAFRGAARHGRQVRGRRDGRAQPGSAPSLKGWAGTSAG